MDGTDLNQAIFHQLGHPKALRPGIGKINLFCNALFKKVQMLRQADCRHDHVQAIDLIRVNLG